VKIFTTAKRVARGFLSGSSALNVQIVVFKEHNGVCVSNPFP